MCLQRGLVSCFVVVVMLTGCTRPRPRTVAYVGGAALAVVGTSILVATKRSEDRCGDRFLEPCGLGSPIGYTFGGVLAALGLVSIGAGIFASDPPEKSVADDVLARRLVTQATSAGRRGDCEAARQMIRRATELAPGVLLDDDPAVTRCLP